MTYLEDLVALLRDPESGNRCGAAMALGNLGRAVADAVPALGQALRYDQNPTVRYRAAEALGQIGGPAGVAALVAALGDNDGLVQVCAADALGEIGPAARDAIPALTKRCQDPSDIVCVSAAFALRSIEEAQRSA